MQDITNVTIEPAKNKKPVRGMSKGSKCIKTPYVTGVFVNEFLSNGFNGTAAAKKMNPLLSDASAMNASSRMLRKAEVMEMIDNYIKPLTLHAFGLATGAESEQVQAKMTIDLLNRAGIGTDKRNININYTVEDIV